jgi:hypothetical protein
MKIIDVDDEANDAAIEELAAEQVRFQDSSKS